MSEFCNILKQLRQKKGITQKEIAKILGISQAAYSLYEKGGREPKYEMLEKIADFFNVSVGYLVSGQKNYIYYKNEKKINEFLDELIKKVKTQKERSELVTQLETLLSNQKTLEDEIYLYNKSSDTINEYLQELGEFLYYNPTHRTLFDSSMEVKKEDVDLAKAMLDRINGKDRKDE